MLAASLPDYPFRRAAHDRLAERRDDAEFLARSWADPTTRVLAVRNGRLATDDSAHALRLLAPDDAPAGERLLLGAADGVVYFLVAVTAEDCIAGARFTGLRQLATVLDGVQASLAVHAVALAGWHERHPRCAQCGAATDVTEAGASRRCPVCGAAHFPRSDPAVIMLVTDSAGRCLLGHHSARGAGWLSTLAGFVEPGESPEQAVVREVREEVGVEVGSVAYAASQPWPFPSSLMLGYFATATTTAVRVDGVEITGARWFSRAELTDAVNGGAVGLPTTLSIAGALISAWYGDNLPANALPV